MSIKKCICLLFAAMVLTPLSLAQLTYKSTCSGTCESYLCTYTDWTYTDSVKHSFPGGDEMWEYDCSKFGMTDLDTFSTDWQYYLRAEGPDGSVTPSGVLYPKYKVVSIIYAPPGNYSSDGFTNTLTDGTTTTIANSFQVGESITYYAGWNFLGVGNTLSWTFGESETTGNSTQVTDTISQASGVSLASIPSNPNAIDHKQDLILIWVNPSIVLDLTGSQSVGYGVGTQFQTAGDPNPGTPEAMDVVQITAGTMLPNSSGNTTVKIEYLEQQQYVDTNGTQYLPGLAAICANQKYYPNNCNADPNGQCGCVPSDFTTILAQDPVLNYASTESPMNADTSGATACTCPSSSDKCRYIPVMNLTGGCSAGNQVHELLEGPECSGCDRIINTFGETDSSSTTETLSESFSTTVGYGWDVKLGNSGLKSSNTFTWTDTESQGAINGSAHTMTGTFSSGTVGCDEDIPVFMDTIFHTFLYYTPSGNNSCP